MVSRSLRLLSSSVFRRSEAECVSPRDLKWFCSSYLSPTVSVRLHSEGGVSFAAVLRYPCARYLLIVPSPIIVSFPCHCPSFHQLQIRKVSDVPCMPFFAFLPGYGHCLEFLMVHNCNLSNQLSHGIREVCARWWTRSHIRRSKKWKRNHLLRS